MISPVSVATQISAWWEGVPDAWGMEGESYMKDLKNS